MSRGRKRKKQQQRNNDNELRQDMSWRNQVIQAAAPLISFDIGLKQHQYLCIEAGPVGDHDNHLMYIKDENYVVTKSRFSADMVMISGRIYNSSRQNAYVYKHPFAVSKNNCKKYLKLI